MSVIRTRSAKSKAVGVNFVQYNILEPSRTWVPVLQVINNKIMEFSPRKGIGRWSTKSQIGYSRKLNTGRTTTDDYHVQETIDFLITLSGESSGFDT